MKNYTSKDIAHAIMAGEVNEKTKFVLETEANGKIEKLVNCLVLLHSVQNGCPLPKYEDDWNKAMSDSSELLKEYNYGYK